MDARRAGPRRVQGKSPLEGEAVQHLRAGQSGDEVRHALVIDLLVEVETRLLPAKQVRLELQAIELDRHRAFERAGYYAVRVGQPLELARGHFVALHDGARRKQLLQRRQDHRLALVHAERRSLHHQHVLELVHDQPAQKIALRVDDAEGSGAGQVTLPHRQRRADALHKELLVHLHALRREPADVDAGLGVEEADSQKPLAMVFDLDHFAVGDSSGHAEDGSAVNPRVAAENAVGLAGTKEHSR